MSFGETILNLLGKKDPRMAMMEAVQGGGTSGTPVPSGGTPVATGTDPAMTAPAAPAAPPQQPAQPQAYTSPPELMQLYTQLLDRQRKTSMIDRGIGMIGSSLAQPENRAGIMAAFGGGSGAAGGGSDPMTMIQQMMQFQQGNMALQQKAASRAALPAIAKQHGIDLATATYLFDSGQLDKVLGDLVKPDNQIVQLDDGTQVIVNKATGEIGQPFGPPKKREIEIRTDDRGTQFSVYKDTGERVGPTNLVEGQGATGDEQLWRADEADRKARGLPTRSLSEFISQTGRARAGAANLGPTGVDYGAPPKDMAWKRDAQGNIKTNEQGAPVAVPIGGGPIEQEQQAEAGQQAARATQKALSAGVVTTNIDDVLGILDDSRDNWIMGPTGWGAAAKWLPSTDARALDNSLTSVKSNLGFEKLQQMRENSPTGGALGQVSDFENKLLQSTFGTLDQFSDQDVFVKNLMRVNALAAAIVNGVVGPDGKARKLTQEDADQMMAEADAKAAAFMGDRKPEAAAPNEGAAPIESIVDKYLKRGNN